MMCKHASINDVTDLFDTIILLLLLVISNNNSIKLRCTIDKYLALGPLGKQTVNSDVSYASMSYDNGFGSKFVVSVTILSLFTPLECETFFFSILCYQM